MQLSDERLDTRTLDRRVRRFDPRRRTLAASSTVSRRVTTRNRRRLSATCILASLIAIGCASAGGGTSDGSQPDAAAVDAKPDGDPPYSCLMVRNCIYLCDRDPACEQRCVDRADDAGRALYDQLVACSIQACPAQDIDCRCTEECFGGGGCLDAFDQCTQSLQEGFCTACL